MMRCSSVLARLFRRNPPGAILPMDPVEEKLLARQREARASSPLPLIGTERSDLLEVEPLDDERIVDGRYYIVMTGDREFFHVAMRRAGEWRYGPHGPLIEGVTGYCPGSRAPKPAEF